MLITPATEADFRAVVALANATYRGAGPTKSWTTEAGVIEGERLNEAQLRIDFAENPKAQLLLARDAAEGPILGTVWLVPVEVATWYLGLLTVDPELQNRQLGRAILAAAEEFVKERGAKRMRMTVLNVRAPLIAWYERRGYRKTGEVQAFPRGDERFGRPLRNDLEFVVLAKNLSASAQSLEFSKDLRHGQ